jgi:hypothetical protein
MKITTRLTVTSCDVQTFHASLLQQPGGLRAERRWDLSLGLSLCFRSSELLLPLRVRSRPQSLGCLRDYDEEVSFPNHDRFLQARGSLDS